MGDFVVTEAEDAVAALVEAFGSGFISEGLFVVLTAVYFDYQFASSAYEVDDHVVDGSLA